MSKLKIFYIAVFSGLMGFSSQVAAQVPFTATTSMPVRSNTPYSFAIANIHNNNTNAIDGFASSQPTGTITLTLTRCANLRRFTIHNNINATTNGVRTFELKYLSDSGTLLGSQTVNVNNGVAPQSVTVPTGPLMAFVKTIEMNITASFDSYAEIREIVLDGVPGPCCP